MTTADHAPLVVALSEVNDGEVGLIGGKAAGLAAMIRAGERVPDGFCVTTAAYEKAMSTGGEIGAELRGEIERAYRRIGDGPVAVRSSATTEDLPYASFAGQHETVLDVTGLDEVVAAVRRCWDSLTNPRAVAYRDTAGVTGPARMGVVVQRMVDPAAAGVLFTANPVTGCRSEMVVDAVAGLGDVVVAGTATADHYVLDETGRIVEQRPVQGGCLSTAQLAELHETGKRLQRRAGAPQDIEWAFDRDGALWLLQTRPITTLFPVPRSPHPGPRVFLEVGHMQGMLRPFTPMGMSVMHVVMADVLNEVGIAADPLAEYPVLADAAGRLFLDITSTVRYGPFRARLPESMTIYGPRVSRAIQQVLADPRFSPSPGRPFRIHPVVSVAARVVPAFVGGLVGALVAPGIARRRAFRVASEIRRRVRPPQGLADATQRLSFALQTQRPFVSAMWRLLPPLYGALAARAMAGALLKGVATPGEVDQTQRGMPHNVTTEMDLELWRLASAAERHRDLLVNTAPAELAARYRAGELPDIGLDEFLRRYGHRGAAEVDVGVPRWAEDPTPVFAAIAGYLQVTDPEQAPDRRFTDAAQQATRTIDDLVRRASRTRPIRARCAGFLLRRSRALAGLRELPKFAWLYALAELRHQLLAAGADLTERGLLDRPDDIMFLTFREAFAAADGADLTNLVSERRADYERELRRRSVPVMILSDGTMPETLLPPPSPTDGVLTGMPAAPGTATGRARVVLDPTGARVEPGEILVAPTTDPGWTPLFLTAAGLVTETGSPVAHGPTVAREYGIPAVICVRDATRRIHTGQLVTIDGAAGTVELTADST